MKVSTFIPSFVEISEFELELLPRYSIFHLLYRHRLRMQHVYRSVNESKKCRIKMVGRLNASSYIRVGDIVKDMARYRRNGSLRKSTQHI